MSQGMNPGTNYEMNPGSKCSWCIAEAGETPKQGENHGICDRHALEMHRELKRMLAESERFDEFHRLLIRTEQVLNLYAVGVGKEYTDLLRDIREALGQPCPDKPQMKYNPDHYDGPVRIVDGNENQSKCVQRMLKSGEWESVTAVHFLSEICDWMQLHRPGHSVTRVAGPYFFYD